MKTNQPRKASDVANAIRAGAPISIQQFCDLYGISRASWYTLQARGEAPRTHRLGLLVRISPGALDDWLMAMEAATKREGELAETAA